MYGCTITSRGPDHRTLNPKPQNRTCTGVQVTESKGPEQLFEERRTVSKEEPEPRDGVLTDQIRMVPQYSCSKLFHAAYHPCASRALACLHVHAHDTRIRVFFTKRLSLSAVARAGIADADRAEGVPEGAARPDAAAKQAL